MFTIASCFHRRTRAKTFHSFLFRESNNKNAAEPIPCPIDNPTESTSSPNGQSQCQLLSAFFPYSQGSEPDVSAYSEAVVQRMERTQEDVPDVVQQSVDASPKGAQGPQCPTQESGSLWIKRSSTPILPAGEDDTEADLSVMESALKMAIDPVSQLSELLTTIASNPESTVHVHAPTDDDNVSSVCDVPSLPGGQPRVHFLGIQGEAESSEEAFQMDRFENYGRNPVDSESGTEGGDESGFGDPQRDAGRTTDPTATIDLDSLPQLSSRSRVLLKRYSEETDASRLP